MRGHVMLPLNYLGIDGHRLADHLRLLTELAYNRTNRECCGGKGLWRNWQTR